MDLGNGARSITEDKEKIMEELQSQLALSNAQTLLTKMNVKCFDKCIPKPGSRLDNSEQVLFNMKMFFLTYLLLN